LLGIPLITDEEGLLVFDSGWPNLDINASVRPGDNFVISFIVKDHSQIVERLSTNGIPYEDLNEVEHEIRAITLRDPDGNRVEIQGLTEKSPDWLRKMVE
jgi:hypothetical protein